MEFRKGDVIKVYNWNAVVIDVFKNENGDEVALQLAFAKDVARSKPDELHTITGVLSIEPSSWNEFVSEIDATRKGQDERMEELEWIVDTKNRYTPGAVAYCKYCYESHDRWELDCDGLWVCQKCNHATADRCMQIEGVEMSDWQRAFYERIR
jgi:hypothetical protein